MNAMTRPSVVALASRVRFVADSIGKSYGGIPVLRNVSFEIRRSEILGIAGENGAGKSTMLRIVSGIANPDTGTLVLDGAPYAPSGYTAAVRSGISMVFQEQALVPNITVYENLFLAHEKLFRNRFGFVDRNAAVRAATTALETLNLGHINPRRQLREFGFEDRQMIEIARAFALATLYRIAEPIILLDEPTAAIAEREVESLFRRVEALKYRGSFVLVTHRLSEYIRLCDRVYVFKDGENIGEVDRDGMCEERLHELMVGRVRAKHYYKEDRQKCTSSEGIAAIEVCNLSGCGVKDVSFALHRGEVLGIGGLLGCGKEDVGQAIIGAAPFPEGGEILVDGRALPIRRRVEAAISAGVGYVPRERRVEGLIPYLPLRWNVSMATLGRLRRLRVPWIDTASESRLVNAQINLLRIKASDPMQLCTHLSGGNQQKVVLAKWLMRGSRILILQNPTRGIDVGVKEEIYALIRDLSEDGVAILLITDDLPELIGLSHRILLMRDGRVAKDCSTPADAKPAEDELIKYMV
jgi:ribose transport system ATP-binding protein